ncbi:hypothetical protein LTR56_027027 [Elasticomyces elasticus]|nr:hypothetical protein LTR56_027027 [Elasticomyces elasticus]KAK3623601.1 hypothetical protein LTR22_024329 [Elasticomyces elasticus]KAK4917980.1 hypothetical protein LTR49_014255 [Elasticomyces elasticus]KAK5743920.1 hypothetical protein LTS12_023647 [Elasticomyces elasticus]
MATTKSSSSGTSSRREKNDVFSPKCKEWGPDQDASTKDGQMLELRPVKLADQNKTCAGWYIEPHSG